MPSVTVIIPVRDEAGAIGSAIASVQNQDYDGDLEVVVADAMSTDGTRAVVAEVAATDPRVRLVDNPAKTTPAGLNAAIVAGRGEVFVRCDAHAELPSGYVSRAVRALHETGADNVGGIQDPVGSGRFSRAVALAMRSLLGTGGAAYRVGGEPGPAETVYLGTFRRGAFVRAGLFDEALIRNQDYELNHRIIASGGLVYFEPDLRVAYRPRDSWRSLASQYWQYGAWKRVVARRNPGSVRLRQMIPVAFVAGLAVSAGLALGGQRRVGSLLPAVYAGAVATATAVAARHGDPAVVLVPVVIPTMHLSWGLGFLLGAAPAEGSRVPTLDALSDT